MDYIDPKELKIHTANTEIYEDREDPFFEESIEKHGILEPLVVNSKNVILSGARRWKIALKLGMKTVPYRVEDPEDEVQAVIEYNRYRQKTPRELYNEAQILERKMKQKASEKLAAGGILAHMPEEERRELSANLPKAHTRELVADQLQKLGAKVSPRQLDKIRYVFDREDREEVRSVAEKLNQGMISVHQAYEQVKRIENPQPIEPQTFKCRACLQKYEEPVQPVKVTLCPECEMDFQIWKAERDASK
ncbi:MAG: ParB/RepB/Spo0J family partition protein [Candidatus Bathyarchaeia archaeon]